MVPKKSCAFIHRAVVCLNWNNPCKKMVNIYTILQKVYNTQEAASTVLAGKCLAKNSFNRKYEN